MSRPGRPSLNLELVPSHVPGAIVHHGARWGLLVALALLTYLLFPVAGGVDVPILQEGDVAQTEVIAPFSFDVLKTPTEREREAAELEATVRPIYEYRGQVADSVLAHTDSLFATLQSTEGAEAMVAVAQSSGVRLTLEDAEYLLTGRRLSQCGRAVRQLLGRQLRRGVPVGGTLDEEQSREILVRRGEREGVARRDTLLTYEGFLQSRHEAHPDPKSALGDPVFVKLLNGLFRPTLVPNRTDYEQRRQQMRESVDKVKERVQENVRIIDANELVTADVRDRLLALRRELLSYGRGSEGNLPGTAGQILANALVLSVFWLLLMLYRPNTYAAIERMLVLSLLFALVIIGAAATHRIIDTDAPELIPIPFAAMLITVLFRARVAMVGAMVLAVLIASQAVYGGSDALFIALVGGVVAAVSVRTIRRRTEFLNAVVLVTGAYLLAGVTVGLRLDWSLAEVGLTGLRGGFSALASAALASTLLPLFESVAGQTTDLTLLELSDPNRPLLRRLATEAQGTYAHSIAMANLCEAACNAIGANGLLARVGCYYHDVGKLKKPQFFVENQVSGSNPHDKLKPEVSAGIIRNHVRDGLALANEHKLPDAVRGFIPEHHGTMEITYFLERARNRDSDSEIKPEEYRYPGPRPRSVETAVAMLADGVEAALRVLDQATPEKLRDAVDHIIKHRIDAGQLEEAPLTLAQLARVRDEFVRVYGGAHHNRIDYPAAGGGIGAEWEAASPA